MVQPAQGPARQPLQLQQRRRCLLVHGKMMVQPPPQRRPAQLLVHGPRRPPRPTPVPAPVPCHLPARCLALAALAGCGGARPLRPPAGPLQPAGGRRLGMQRRACPAGRLRRPVVLARLPPPAAAMLPCACCRPGRPGWDQLPQLPRHPPARAAAAGQVRPQAPAVRSACSGCENTRPGTLLSARMCTRRPHHSHCSGSCQAAIAMPWASPRRLAAAAAPQLAAGAWVAPSSSPPAAHAAPPASSLVGLLTRRPAAVPGPGPAGRPRDLAAGCPRPLWEVLPHPLAPLLALWQLPRLPLLAWHRGCPAHHLLPPAHGAAAAAVAAAAGGAGSCLAAAMAPRNLHRHHYLEHRAGIDSCPNARMLRDCRYTPACMQARPAQWYGRRPPGSCSCRLRHTAPNSVRPLVR